MAQVCRLIALQQGGSTAVDFWRYFYHLVHPLSRQQLRCRFRVCKLTYHNTRTLFAPLGSFVSRRPASPEATIRYLGAVSAAGLQPRSLSNPLMSCANAAMLSVIDQIPPSRRVLFAMLRSVARISTPLVLPIPLGVFPQRNFPHPVHCSRLPNPGGWL